MSSFEETEKLINSTMDSLPPSFMIFGKKKEPNALEDFWMSKLEAIERQYNEHIVKLERTLLDNKANRRVLIRKQEQLTRLKSDIKDKTNKLESLSKQTGQLQNKLSLQKYKVTSLGDRLLKSDDVKSKILKSLENERFERMRCERELVRLKLRLTNLERDKKFLTHEVSIKESERRRVEEREGKLSQNKWNLIKNLTDIDQERRVQTQTNIQLVDSIGHLLDAGKSQEFKLLKQRKEIDMILEAMKQKREEHEDALRKLGIRQKELQQAGQENKFSREKLEHFERQVKHWKEEFKFKEEENKQEGFEIKDLQRENSNLRCQLAELREKLNKNGSKLKTLSMEKQRTGIELEKTKAQARSVHLVMCRNELMKQKLSEKILKAHPSIKLTLDQRASKLHAKGSKKQRDASGQLREIESYKKKIWNLERQKSDLEREINDSKGKHNRLQMKLDKYSGMEEQIKWTEKAMVKLEGDRNRLEDLMKSMTLNIPKKIPFEKLVTDPSILDRMAKYQVLQKRLLNQSAKVEGLKRSAVKIMEYRKLKSEEEFADTHGGAGNLHQWRLSHWKHSSEDTLADVDNQMFEPEGQGSSLVDRKYYKDYISFLDSEIPVVRKQIAVLERRQQYNSQQLLDAETKSKKQKQKEEDLKHHGSLDNDDILAQQIVGIEEVLDTVIEDEEEDEENIEDSDMDGLLAVVSIDEPSSARVPSTSPRPINSTNVSKIDNENVEKDSDLESNNNEYEDDEVSPEVGDNENGASDTQQDNSVENEDD